MINCIIIEDQEPAQRILKKYISDVPELNITGCFSDAISALEFLKTSVVDLIFLDIHLPKLSGMDFLAVLNPKPHIILTTAFSNYALKSYDYDVTDYLLKPFSFDRFLKAIYKVKKLNKIIPDTAKPSIKDAVLVKVGYHMVKIKFEEILYIQSDGDYTQVYCKNKKHMVSQSLKQWQNTLPQDRFVQIHRSYIVNINTVEMLGSEKAYINHKALSIGRVYKKDFLEAFNKHHLK